MTTGAGPGAATVIGTSWMRKQDFQDQLLVDAMRERGLTEIPLYARDFPERTRAMQRWIELAPLRDGPVRAERAPATDTAAVAAAIKARARALGADLVGATALRPGFVELGTELAHASVIAIACYEDYAKVLDGPDAVDLEAMRVYARCAEIATDLARYIREEWGYPALAHHNGGTQIQAIPVMHAVGFGELGKHGSLINPQFGANFRPGFVTTDLPLDYDRPIEFGVQDYCLTCNLCRNNCPADAIPAAYITTDGVKRWLIDNAKCYTVSRFREEYCHICIDACPYIHKTTRDPERRATYKTYMAERKHDGYRTPKSNRKRG